LAALCYGRQDRAFRRIGNSEPRTFAGKVIALTRDPDQEIGRGLLRIL
jgi:hypothetical protein